MHVLFGDDSEDTRDLIRLCFGLKGHSCVTAHNGSEALRLIAQDVARLDAIILDFNMPGLSGIEVVQEIRKMEGLPQMAGLSRIPIILCTGEVQRELEGPAREWGIARVVYKPILPADLLALLQDLVV